MNYILNEETLNEALTTPSQGLIEDIAKIDGDIMVLGAGGKMGPDICILAKKAIDLAGLSKKVYSLDFQSWHLCQSINF